MVQDVRQGEVKLGFGAIKVKSQLAKYNRLSYIAKVVITRFVEQHWANFKTFYNVRRMF